MKYIRTKDGEVRATSHLHKNEDGSYQNAHREMFGLPEIIVVKEADAIEELCDAYVLSKNNHCCVVGDVEAREMAAANHGAIYGAIWVFDGKGVPTLKPVAKMDEKGGLLLL